MTSPAANLPVGCTSTYGILVCQQGPGPFHYSRLASGEWVRWRDGCDESCTADCGACKGRLRRDREAASPAQGR